MRLMQQQSMEVSVDGSSDTVDEYLVFSLLACAGVLTKINCYSGLLIFATNLHSTTCGKFRL